MGLFGKFAYSDGRWTRGAPTAVPFLLVDVHDSRIATVDHRRGDASGGRFFLGYEPRFYFDEVDASDPVDVDAEAQGFAAWAKEATGADVEPAELPPLLASPSGVPPTDESVELTVDRLAALAGLPPLEWPTEADGYAS